VHYQVDSPAAALLPIVVIEAFAVDADVLAVEAVLVRVVTVRLAA